MSNFLIVGIGASAGGVKALKEFFEHVPVDSGIAYVAILHLSPDHDSQLAQVLQSATAMPVMQVTEKVHVQPDNVYVIPPDRHLIMEDGYIAVTHNTLIEERRAPIDIFFRSLAESHQANAVCVVLSGTGANGSMGLKRVKERGGAAFVQSPREAEFSEMPRHSIATDLVDDVLPVADIPAKIIAYKDRLGTVRIPVEAEQRVEDQQLALREVFTQLRVRTGHDFTNYKRPTLLRRIERRINIRSLPDLPAYTSFMQDHPEETDSLLKDLLISVTNFFRDKKAFEELELNVMPRLFKDKTSEDQVRIWVAGCATGEEAYSIAMLCAERTQGVIDAPKVQIFATDIDEAAINHARNGIYTINDAADVSPERLRRFFSKEGDSYRIRREIREMILFAHHNFLKDPPFAKLDLISCRNVLIYLNHTAQERLMEIFHFSLNTGGYLFLGTSESVDGATALYTMFNREHHIYQSRQASTRAYHVPDSVPLSRFEQLKTAPAAEETPARPPERITYGDLHLRLLEQYAPPSVIVNEEYDIVHISERAGRYLRVAGGEPSQNLLKLVREELRLELHSALYQATKQNVAVEAHNLTVNIDGAAETISLHIRPALREGDIARGFILVVFEQAIAEAVEKAVVISSDEPAARQLEDELTHLKARLRSSNEQHELQSEELQASNEELQAMNEELRSAAEELETSQEELQSINEELSTVNQELKVKVEEVTLAGNNMQNLINSTDIGTIFLDRSFRVMLFTPAARGIFNLISADYGRLLSDITSRLDDEDIFADAETVLEKLHVIEREVRTNDGHVFLMRQSPYRTAEDHIQGVVVTFVDITERKRAEVAKYFLASIVESSEDSVVTVNFDGRITSWNKSAEWLYGYPASEAIGQPLTLLTLPEDLKQVLSNIEKIKHSKTVEVFDTVRVHKDGRELNLEIVLSPVKDVTGAVIGVSTIARDVTERKQAETALREVKQNFEIALKAARMGVWDIDFTTGKARTDLRHNRIFGYTSAVETWNIDVFRSHILPEDQERFDKVFAGALINGMLDLQVRIRWRDGRVHWIYDRGKVYYDEQRQPVRMVGVTLDITESKQAEDAMRKSEERFRILTDTMPQLVWTNEGNGNANYFNRRWFDYSGLSLEESVGPGWQAIVHPDDAQASIERWEHALASGETFDAEYRLRRADGVYRWHIGRNVPLRDDADHILGWFGSATDIEELKQA